MRALLIFWLLIAPFAAVAQGTAQEEADKSYLASLISDNLSGAGREVLIYGFAGALSSRATIDRLTVADAEGVWLTLEGVVFDWNRAALLRGAIDIQEMSATRIGIARLPSVDDGTMPSVEAKPFQLPDLPVSVNIETLSVETIALGAPLLGEPIDLSLTGKVGLSGGEGSATISAERLNGQTGSFEIAASYSNDTNILGLTMNVVEAEDGIVARLLDLPGRPSVRLALDGTAPVSDYAATLTIATDGTERLNGELGLTTVADDTPETAPERRFRLDVGGDVTALFAPQYQKFFGNDVALVTSGSRDGEGRITLDQLDLRTQSLRLAGAAVIGPDRWPESFSLTGDLGNADGSAVLLPLGGPETFVQSASLDLQFDAADSDKWTVAAVLNELDRPGLGIDQLKLNGIGLITPAEGAAIGQVAGDITYSATGLTLDDAGMADAFGDRIDGTLVFRRQEGEPVIIDEFTLAGPGVAARLDGTIAGPDDGYRIDTTLTLQAEALARFAALTGQNLAGAADLTVVSTIIPLDRSFSADVSGTTTDLQTGIAQLDPLLRGAGTIALNAARDADGTRIEGLAITTPEVELTADVDLSDGASKAVADLAIANIGLIVPDLTGPATVMVDLERAEAGAIKVNATADVAAAILTVEARSDDDAVTFDIDTTLDASDLSQFAGLADYDLRGAAVVQVAGTIAVDLMTLDLGITAQTRDLGVGIAQLDPLLRGAGTLSAQVVRVGDAFALNSLVVSTPALGLLGAVDIGPNGDSAEVSLTITDLAPVMAGLSGPASLTASGTRSPDGAIDANANLAALGARVILDATRPAAGAPFAVNATATAADLSRLSALTGQSLRGSLDATVSGDMSGDFSTFDLSVDAQTGNLGIGVPTVDALIGGAGRISGQFKRPDSGGLNVTDLSVAFPNLRATADLNGADSGAGQGRFDATIPNIGVLTDELSGPLTASGTANRAADGVWTIDTDATGPGGTNAAVNGQIGAGGNLALNATGSVPLGLLNGVLEPRRLRGTATFDLGINGPASLNAISGTVRTSDARLADPRLGEALEGIAATITLDNGTAQVDVTAQVVSGGRISVNGGVGLSGGYPANLTVQLDSVTLRDPQLYETTVNGQIGVDGPLAGGAQIAGVLTLGETEIQVPSSAVGALGKLPDVTHVGAPADVRQTLDRAGIGTAAQATTQTRGPVYPIDITINAPARIFVRGRGLDAELGGTLTLGGTTANVIPQGQFDLIRGRLSILNQRFDLTEGYAALQGGFVPFIRLVATTTAATGTVINIVIEGPANEPTVTFTSNPELPQDEILAQLIFGRDLSSISPLQAVQLASAVGTLAGRGGTGLVDQFRQGLGLDDFDITSDADGNAAVRAGKYLSENVYTDVTLGADGSADVTINLDVTDNLTARGSVGSDGDTRLGIFYERDY